MELQPARYAVDVGKDRGVTRDGGRDERYCVPLLRTPCPNFFIYNIDLCKNCECTVSFDIVSAFNDDFFYFRSMPTASTKCVSLEGRS